MTQVATAAALGVTDRTIRNWAKAKSRPGFKRQVVFRIGTEEWPLLEAAVSEHGSIQAAVLAGLRAMPREKLHLVKGAIRMIERRSIRIRSIALMSLVVAILATAAWSLGAVGRGNDATASGGLWTWPEGIPGQSDPQLSPAGEASLNATIELTNSLAEGIQTNTIKRVAPIGTSATSHGLVLLAASGPNDSICVTVINDDLISARQFSCIDESLENAPVLRFVASGGAVPDVADWVGIVGVARSDVSRVTLVPSTAVGSEAEIELPLNTWRGFYYSADAPQPFPRLLRTYGLDGKLIEEESTVP